EEWPVDADVVVVDESSMLDAELAAALVEACADGTRLLLVGDPAQLPSIGAGGVLADTIDSGAVPVTELTTLYRQRAGGVIARLATAVRGGELPRMESAAAGHGGGGGAPRGGARGGRRPGPRQPAGRAAGDAARHRFDPPRARHHPGRHPGRHAGA